MGRKRGIEPHNYISCVDHNIQRYWQWVKEKKKLAKIAELSVNKRL